MEYGYKSQLSTIYAIVEIEAHVDTYAPDTGLLLMGLTKAFGKVNRPTLWAARYKIGFFIDGIPILQEDARTQNYNPKAKANMENRMWEI